MLYYTYQNKTKGLKMTKTTTETFIKVRDGLFAKESDTTKMSSLFEITIEKMVDGEKVEVGCDYLENIKDEKDATAWFVDGEEYPTYGEMMADAWEDCYLLPNGDAIDAESESFDATFFGTEDSLELWETEGGEQIALKPTRSEPTLYRAMKASWVARSH